MPLTGKLEVWGGVECTYNRVRDQYFDQLKYNGHDRRIEDLDRFAGIGLRTLRYPFIWERTAPDGIASADWSWADARLARLRELGIRPIAGFVHHGSGPRHTSLMDPEFGPKLAEYAGAFARRYPWVGDYTPINELFTTARFSAMYGVWYPHLNDFRSCMTALMNEVRGTVLSMREIRKTQPGARLIQTDDLGKASSTPKLQYQVDFENERRWIGWDLLCGRVTKDHPIHGFLTWIGVDADELAWFADNPCPPDIIGINHYPLSNRHLDERLERYPEWSHGGNGRDAYADVSSVVIEDAAVIPAKTILREAWERYRIPIAVTEAHIDAGREDQLRWFMGLWKSCLELRQEGVDVRAVTAWGLLGHFDWHCLVTRCDGHYESGVYDARSPEPRPTALAGMLHSLAATGDFAHPLLEEPGWWDRPIRVHHPARAKPPEPGSPGSYGDPARSAPGRTSRPLLIAGGRGTLGRAFARVCEARGIPYRLVTRDEMDIADPASVAGVLEGVRPWALVNAAGYVRVDDAECDVERCFRENTEGPATLAVACAARGLPLVTFSSDLIFDGDARSPYVESSRAAPLNVYGRSKAEAEARVLERHPGALVIRTSAFFGPWDEANFVSVALREARQGRFRAIADAKVSPTYLPDLVHTTLNLMVDREHGIWHLANAGAVTWAELALEAVKAAGISAERIVPAPAAELGLAAPRPGYSVLGSERGMLLPPLDKALGRYFEETKGRITS